MKYSISTIIIILLFLRVEAQNDKNNYYWYEGEKQYLNNHNQIKYCLLKESFDFNLLKQLDDDCEIINYGLDDAKRTLIPFGNSANDKYKKWILFKSNENLKMLDEYKILGNFGFKNEYGEEVGLSHLFYVKLKNQSDLKLLEQMCEEYEVVVIGQNKFMSKWFTLSSESSSLNSLQLSNIFYESDVFAESTPDLLINDELGCVNDPDFGSLWGHTNINSCGAWNITNGNQTVTIAILDNGIEMTHEDLADNIHPLSFDTESGTSPSQIFGDHGTHCAGIAGAVGNNDVSVIGLANNCRLMSVSNSLAASPNSRQRRADGINWAWKNGADVISNSWFSGQMFPIIDDAINLALTEGREGLGTIVVFASGNNNGSVSYPANSNSNILVVGASTQNNQRASFSNFGNELDVVAPGSNILSTVPNNGTGFKRGTSMACPHVAGLAGLILSLDPCLTVQEVNDVIESTAQKINNSNVTYNTTSGRTNGVWNNEMGYGLIDAEAALLSIFNKWLLQNEVQTGNKLVASHSTKAGKNVDPNQITGDYIIANGADVEFKSTKSITLEHGFTASVGSNFLAHIKTFSGDCNQWNTKNLWITTNLKKEIVEEKKIDENKEKASIETTFFPNPYTNDLYVKNILPKESEIDIYIYDIQGKLLYTKKMEGKKGVNIHHIDFFTESRVVIAKVCIDKSCQTTKLMRHDK